MAINFIYGLRDPETMQIRYIGKTNDMHRRWLNHLCEKSKTHRYYWIRSLDRRGLRPEMITLEEIRGNDSLSDWPWQESERRWIAYGIRSGWPLVNMTSGGDGVSDCAKKPRKYSGDEHWTRKKPECVARGERNGAARHPELTLRGSQCPSSKLTEGQVREIRRMSASGVSNRALGIQFNVGHRNVWHIVKGKTWKHVN